MSKYTTVQEAAAALGVSERTIQYRLRTGIMRADRLGRAWLIPVRELEHWMAAPKPVRGSRLPKRAKPRYTSVEEPTSEQAATS